jgi:hypothetical protein
VLAGARARDEPTVLAAVLEAYRLDRRAVADLLAEV